MHADTKRMRTNAQTHLKPLVMTHLKTRTGVAEVVKFIETRGMQQKTSTRSQLKSAAGLPETWVSGLNQQS